MTTSMIRGILVLFAAQAVLGQGDLVPEPKLVIKGGTLIDGTGRPPLANSVIVIEGDRITAVGEQGQVSIPPDARTIEAAGKFILPGLSDMHIHWQEWMPELFLAYGVTSVVDLESGEWTLDQRDLISDGRMKGPRIFTASHSLFGRLIWDSPESSIRPVLTSPEMARRQIRSFGSGRANYNLTKIYTELAPDHLEAITEESHALGRNVMGHLGSLDARQAARLGIDGLAHGSGIALATIADPVKARELRSFVRLGIAVDYPFFLMYHAYTDAALMEELIELLVEEEVAVEFEQVNTAGRWVPENIEKWSAEDTRLMQNPDLQYIPASTRDRVLYYQPYYQLSDEQRRLVAEGYLKRRDFLGKFAQAGGKVLAGTDSASFLLPGISLHRELELLVEAGLSPMEAIQAATQNNFEFLQVNDLGTIEPGKLADLILLGEDPLEDIRNTRKLEMVIKNGLVVDTSYNPDFTNPLPRDFAVGGFINPTPYIRVMYPMSISRPRQEVTLRIEGTNLVDESVVEFDGVQVPSEPVPSTLLEETRFNPVYTQLEATIPAGLLTRVGSYSVMVKNPRPQGGTSNRVTFFVAP